MYRIFASKESGDNIEDSCDVYVTTFRGLQVII